jgi:hypothetical protein
MLIIMHDIALCTPCIAIMLESHTCTFVLHPVEPKPEEQQELAPVEDANPEQDQCKPRCIRPPSLSFVYLLCLVYDSWMCIRL